MGSLSPLVLLLAVLLLVGSCQALLAAGIWRTNLTLSASPLAERPAVSPTHCVVMCGAWPSQCSAVTFVAGAEPSCRLHELAVCDDPDGLSLVPLDGARYYDLYQEHWELRREGGADCQTAGRCDWRCYCSLEACPVAGVYPSTVYTCELTECNLNAGYWQASSALALPLWAEEVATDGQLPIKKTFVVNDRLVFRFEVKVSQVAEVAVTIRGTLGEYATVTAGANGNMGLRVEGFLLIPQTVTIPGILSTTEFRRVSLVFRPGGGYDITGEDETLSLYHVPLFPATSLASVEFTSPPGVSAFWRMEAGLADSFLLTPSATEPGAPLTVDSAGAFLRIAPVTEYEITFEAAAIAKVWVEFRQEYLFQDDKVLRFTIHDYDRTDFKPFRPLGVTVGVSSGGEFTQDVFRKVDLLVVIPNDYTEVTLRWSGSSVHITSYGLDTTLDASVALPEVSYIGVGCDDTQGARIRMSSAADPGWSTNPWREEGNRGYSTGNNLP